jgi:abhydrolase domain-containing protein 14
LPVIEEKSTVQWLGQFVRDVHLSNFVIVSPSMSGRFAVPYVIESSSSEASLRGFVPIAPAGTDKFEKVKYERLNVIDLDELRQ